MNLATRGSKRTPKRSFFKGATAAFALGLPGIVAVGVSAIGDLRQIPELADLPATALFLVAVMQPLVLLAIGCLVGTALASRVKLHSHLLARVTGRVQPPALFAEELPIAIGVGGAVGVVVIALDFAFSPFLPTELSMVAAGANSSVFDVLASVPVRFLYGGVTEELVMRYGLMTVLAWAGWKVVGGNRPSNRVMWAAIALSAVVFGLGHLPAASVATSLTPVVVARTMLLNTIAGIGFGWLYWRQSLESAMVGHVTFHVVAVAVSLVL